MFDVDKAIAFNDRQLVADKLTRAHLAYLVEYFQAARGLVRDGMAGDGATLPSLVTYTHELAEAKMESIHPTRPFGKFVHSLPSLHGRQALISCPFGDRRKNPKTGLWTGHGGGDFAFQATALERKLFKDGKLPKASFNGSSFEWYMPSEELEIPYLASTDGYVRVAGEGKAKNGQKVIEVVVDYGDVSGVGIIAIEGLHFKRLLRGRGSCKRGEPLAIIGHTATDKNHLHGEVWSDAQWDKDGVAERLEKADPAPIYAQMVRFNYDPPAGVVTFDPQYLAAA